MTYNPLEKSIIELQQAMDVGELTAQELTQFYLDRITELDTNGPRLNAISSVNADALKIAGELDRERQTSGKRSPLHGIPVVIKDNFFTKDMATTASSQLLADYHPTSDAELVRRLREAGAIILAKTNLSEFACHGWTDGTLMGQTLNPYDLTRTPGGSSGGSGTAVAANLSVAALGTDTANSVRSPASATCLVGFRPTTGLFSTEGVIPVSKTQDSPGTLTRTVTDAAVLFDYLASDDETRPSYLESLKDNGLKGKRIGLLTGNLGDDEAVVTVINLAVEMLQFGGAEVIPVDIPELDSDRVSKVSDVQVFEFQDELNAFIDSVGDWPIASFQDIVDSGKLYPPIQKFFERCASTEYPRDFEDYRQKLANIERNKTVTLEVMEKYALDGFVFPHQKILVEKIGALSQAGRNGILASTMGFPSVSVPAGFSTPSSTAPLGVPVGMEFLAKPGQEALLFEMAFAFEKQCQIRKQPVL